MIRSALLPFFLLTILLSGCGGGGGGGASDNGPAPHQVKILAAIHSGGADEFSLDNGIIVFSDYNRGELLKVASDGGEIQTLYADSWTSPWMVVQANGKVFVLNAQTKGGIYSIPNNSIGVVSLLRNVSGVNGEPWSNDIIYDGTFVYWCKGSNVHRTPLKVTPTNSIETIFSGTEGGNVRIAWDNGWIYITDQISRKLLRINTNTLKNEELVTFSTNLYSSSSEKKDIELVIDKNYVYASIDYTHIHRINKINKQETIIPATFISYYNTKIASDESGMYWWDQSDANQLSLKKSSSTSDNILTLTTIPFTWNIDATISDGLHVYWFEHEFSDLLHDDLYKIQRVPIGGGDVELVASYTSNINFSSALAPSSVTFDSTSLYWSSMATNLIAKISKSGGTPEIVTKFDTYFKVTAIDGFILAANRYGLTKIPINGTTPATSEWSLPDTSSSNPKQMTKDGSNLYWTVDNGTANEGYETDVYSKPLSGGTAIKLTSVPAQNNVNKLYPYDDTLFLAESTYNGGLIRAISKTGGNERILGNLIGFEPNDLQIIGSIMYLLADGVHTINLNTGETKTLVQQAGTKSIYVDGMYIYWSSGGGLYRIPVAGGAVMQLYYGPSEKVTGDNTRIYWATGFQILSMEK